MEAIDGLANNPSLMSSPPSWFDSGVGNLSEDTVAEYWDTIAQESSVDDTGNTRYVAGLEGLPQGSVDVTKMTIIKLGVYGRCQRNGVTTIKVGYLKAY